MSEKVVGSSELTKFNTIFVSTEIPHDSRIHELGQWLQKLATSNVLPDYGTGAFGNLSFRIDKHRDVTQKINQSFIITASGLKSTNPENFVKVVNGDFATFTVEVIGCKKPSSESLLHLALYQARPEINAIFHGHNEQLLVAAEKLGLPCTAKEEPYGSLELIEGVLEIIGQHNFLIMKNHGFISLGKTLNQAGRQILDFLGKLAE